MKAKVDPEKCIGCGLCAQVSPEVYHMEAEVAVAAPGELMEDQLEPAKEGAEQCPVDAITIS
ncbi:MAG: ferredoxin [Candidatus Omnitrophica bacterium]|nr:ferredoxin [Candidatus Omnitrophota bacterium]